MQRNKIEKRNTLNISYNWLQQFITVDLSEDRVSEILTDLGLEVEGTSRYESIKGSLSGVVVGEVLECHQHPNADRLKVTQVAIGAGAPVQIVCGAPNVAQGQKVPVATVGTTLYDKEGNAFKISKSKIRGEVSQGMICAEDELGLGDGHDGILVLDDEWDVGTPCSEIFSIEQDIVIEIGLTPNRADAMSHMGVARDLKAACIQNKIPYDWCTPEINSFHIANYSRTIPVEVINTKQAPQYFGLTISNVSVKPSPDWLQNRLKAIGITPKNNIVDVTNYVLHELGQPLHAFDADKISDKIIVQNLPAGTPFTTLDGVERKLHQDDLMICDAEGPLCLAGIFGGLHSGVSATTKTIFLESAYFDPVAIRKAAKRHGLNTDASFRFERGIDLEIGVYALKRAAILIRELSGGEFTSDIEEYTQPLPDKVSVILEYNQLEKTIGQSIPIEELNSILQSLEIKVIHSNVDGLALEIPRYRVDVTRPADVIEEILRVYGYNNIDTKPLQFVAQPKYNWKDANKLENATANKLTAMGFFEMMNNSLGSQDYKTSTFFEPVTLMNPLGQELSQLRQSLVYGALEAVAFNLNRQNKNVKLFEFGHVYGKDTSGFKQAKRLIMVLSGDIHSEHWEVNHQPGPFFYLKGVIEDLFATLTIPVNLSDSNHTDWMQEGITINHKNKDIGALGLVSPKLLESFAIDKAVYMAELDWETICKCAHAENLQFIEVPKFPFVRRDFALLLDKNISFDTLKETALTQDRKILKSVSLFDVYEGKNLPENKKSYGLSFYFQDTLKTLTDKQVDKVMEKLKKTFETKFDAKLR